MFYILSDPDSDPDSDPEYTYLYYFIATFFTIGGVCTACAVLFNANQSKPIKPPTITISKMETYLRNTERIFDRAVAADAGTDITDTGRTPGKSSWLYEQTPNETIIMNYDADEKAYTYYCNSRSVPYNVLDAVSKKFCAYNKCPTIYTKLEVIEEEIKKKKPRSNTDNHNFAGRGNAAATAKSFTILVKKKMNIFLRKGNVREFSFLSKPVASATTTNTTLTFADFKNKFKSDNL